MNVKGILFDKDGTLLDFDAFWVTISKAVIHDLCKTVGAEALPQELFLRAIGVQEDGTTDIRGVLCCGTYAQIGAAFARVLRENGISRSDEEITRLTIDGYHTHADCGEIKPTCSDLSAALTHLKAQGIRLAVVTTDDPFVTKKCLGALGIDALFDFVFTDDGITPTKPDPTCIRLFCEKTGCSKDELCMVGDTLTDTAFAKNGGIRAIGLAKNAQNKAILAGQADCVISAISELPDVL